MGLLKNLKLMLSKNKTLSEPVYMENNAAFVCQDQQEKVLKTTRIVAQHINENLDNPIDFPRFLINKTSALQGSYGMHSKNVLVLDADDCPTEGSKNLLTSGSIFNVVMALQNQIDELKEYLKK